MTPALVAAGRMGLVSNPFLSLLMTIAIGYACGAIAQRKGRSRIIWSIVGFLFSFLALAAILLIPRRRALSPRGER